MRPPEPTPSPAATVPSRHAVSLGGRAAGTVAVPADTALSKATAERLQAALERLVGSSATKGAAAAMVTPDGTWTGVTGVDGAGAPIEPDSAFGIGSVSKTVTAAEILLLASQGKLTSTPRRKGRDAALRRPGRHDPAARHDAGRPPAPVRHPAISRPRSPKTSAGPGRSARCSWVKDLPRLGTVGGPSKYNGTNYQVLSQVIEKVTGKPLATAFRDDLLGPAGLDRMWTQVGEQPQAPLAIAVDPGTGIVDVKSGFLPSKAAASTGKAPAESPRTPPRSPGGATCSTGAGSSIPPCSRR